jgi:predicted nucleic acid-binding protein
VATDLYTRPYFDASVWISWIKNEVINGVERGKIVAHLLQHAERKAFPIYTSTLSLAEVHKQRTNSMLTDAQDEQILAFFEHEYIHFIEVDRGIGEHANRLCRDKSIMPPGVKGLLPNDAIHLACALRAKCDYLLAWDEGILKCRHPAIKIEAPEMRGQAFLAIVPPVELK